MQKRLLSLGQGAVLGALVGLLSGSASALFLDSLSRVTALRLGYPGLVWLLPLAGLLMGYFYQRFGHGVLAGNNLVLDRMADGGPTLPKRMAPMVLLGTLWSHLFGASVGREGTAVQMGAGLSDQLARAFNLDTRLRKHLLIAGIAGGFGSVFGTPLAGAIFGLEVMVLGSTDYDALVPALIAALVGDATTRAWGLEHQIFPLVAAADPFWSLGLGWILLAALVAATAWIFIELTHRLKLRTAAWLPALPLRMAAGGLAVLLASQVFGLSDYLGLGTPLIGQALGEGGGPAWGFAAKLGLTVLSLGFGFIGGEVTPLFVIGALLGRTVAPWLGLPPVMAAGVSMAALFGACANTPLAMVLMAVELMGAALLPQAVLVSVLAWVLSGHRGIYGRRVRSQG